MGERIPAFQMTPGGSLRLLASRQGILALLPALLFVACGGSGLPEPAVSPDSCDLPTCCPAGFSAVEGTDGDDRLHGGWSADCVLGRAGSDSLRGSCGDDRVLCGAGDDRCSGGFGADHLVGGGGADVLFGKSGRDLLEGGPGDDVLKGGFGRDDLRGSRGDDSLYGGHCADRLRPGPGSDQSFGGGGSDVFVIGNACEVSAGETIDGGSGFDRVQSPLDRAALEALGASFVSIESFEIIGPLFDECVELEAPWGPSPVAPPPGSLFARAAPRVDGGALAISGNGAFAVSPEGTVTPMGVAERAYLDPAGERYALRTADILRMHEADGTMIGSFAGLHRLGFVKLAPGGALIYAPETEEIRETGVVQAVRMRRPDGTLVGDFAADGLEISRLLSDRIIYTQGSVLRARRFDGSAIWSAPVDVHKIETNGERSIVVPRWTQGRLLHLTGATETHSAVVDGVVWNLAMSASGQYSAATTQTKLYIFDEGELVAQVDLPVTYANSLAISDRGEALVGGQDGAGQGLVLLYHHQGSLLWRGEAGVDTAGWRPEVAFAADGDRILWLERRGLTAYDILRSAAP